MTAVDLGGRALRRAQGIRSRLASRYFVSLGKADPDIIFIAGTGRSGTTWLTELLARNTRRRVVFEPFRPDEVAVWRTATMRQYLRPSDTPADLLRAAEIILGGDFRSSWSDQHNRRFLTQGLLIKDIGANLILRWLYEHFGPFPIVYLLRHPLAVAMSWRRDQWTVSDLDILIEQPDLIADHLASFQEEIKSARNEFDRLIYEWCVENYVPLHQFTATELTVVFYEDLVLYPERELARIAACTGIDVRLSRDLLASPSATTSPKTTYNSPIERVMAWEHGVSRGERIRARAITSTFGLGEIYDEHGLPTLSSGESLIDALQAQRALAGRVHGTAD